MVTFKLILITLAITIFVKNADAGKYTIRVLELNTI